MATRMDVAVVEVPVTERGGAWPVSWSAIWVGALGATTATLIGGLLAVAFRAYDVHPGNAVGPEDLGIGELIASVCIAFFACVIGGWAAARIAG